jgi:hypothetical protein
VCKPTTVAVRAHFVLVDAVAHPSFGKSISKFFFVGKKLVSFNPLGVAQLFLVAPVPQDDLGLSLFPRVSGKSLFFVFGLEVALDFGRKLQVALELGRNFLCFLERRKVVCVRTLLVVC